MKRIGLIMTFLVFAVGVHSQGKSTFKADENTEAQEEIKNLEFLLASLLEKGDHETYSGYLTDDYIRIDKNGGVSTKEQIIEGLRSRPSKGNMKMKPYDLSVRVYGNTAILQGKLDVETKSGDTTNTTSSLFTKIFIRKDGKWYLASLQGTSLK